MKMSGRSQMNKRPAKYSKEETLQWQKDKMQANALQLFKQPEDMFYIDVCIYHQKSQDRLTVNVDFIFSAGGKPFETTANCVSRDRKRELTRNVKHPDWPGYLDALTALSAEPNGVVYAGKLKNRVSKYTPLSRHIIPKTVLIVCKHTNHYEVAIMIRDTVYTIDCKNIANSGSSKQVIYFSHHGSMQIEEETEYDFTE